MIPSSSEEKPPHYRVNHWTYLISQSQDKVNVISIELNYLISQLARGARSQNGELIRRSHNLIRWKWHWCCRVAGILHTHFYFLSIALTSQAEIRKCLRIFRVARRTAPPLTAGRVHFSCGRTRVFRPGTFCRLHSQRHCREGIGCIKVTQNQHCLYLQCEYACEERILVSCYTKKKDLRKMPGHVKGFQSFSRSSWKILAAVIYFWNGILDIV